MSRHQPGPRESAAARVVAPAWAPLGFPCTSCAGHMDDTASWCSDCRTMRTATNMRLARWRHRYGTTYPPLHPPARATQKILNLLADPSTPISPRQIRDALDTAELAELLCIAQLVEIGILTPRRSQKSQTPHTLIEL